MFKSSRIREYLSSEPGFPAVKLDVRLFHTKPRQGLTFQARTAKVAHLAEVYESNMHRYAFVRSTGHIEVKMYRLGEYDDVITSHVHD